MATWTASTFGVWVLLPVLPLIWLGIGTALCVACVATSRLFQPRLSVNRPVPMYSMDFARWWLVGFSLSKTKQIQCPLAAGPDISCCDW